MAEGSSSNSRASCDADRSSLPGFKQAPQICASSTESNNIHEREEIRIMATESPQTKTIDPRYKVDRDFFTPGKVFKLLWTEPRNEHTTQINTKHPTYEGIRQFVIVARGKGHCQCLPINTYENQGTIKRGLDCKHHEIRYTESKNSMKDRASVASKGTSGSTAMDRNADDSWEKPAAKPCNTAQCDQSELLGRMKRAPKMTAVSNSVSGFMMATSFIWFNKRMELSQPSKGMNTITEAITRGTSPNITHALDIIPTEAIFATFVLSTAVFTGSAGLWATNNTQAKGANILGWIIMTILLVLCILVGFTAEELLLVCLPLSISLGSGISCLLGLLKSDLQHGPDHDLVSCTVCEMEKDVVFEV